MNPTSYSNSAVPGISTNNSSPIPRQSSPILFRIRPYKGKTPAELSGLISSDFLPSVASSLDQIAAILRTIVCQLDQRYPSQYRRAPALSAATRITGGRGRHFRAQSIHGLLRSGADRHGRRAENRPLAVRRSRPIPPPPMAHSPLEAPNPTTWACCWRVINF